MPTSALPGLPFNLFWASCRAVGLQGPHYPPDTVEAAEGQAPALYHE